MTTFTETFPNLDNENELLFDDLLNSLATDNNIDQDDLCQIIYPDLSLDGITVADSSSIYTAGSRPTVNTATTLASDTGIESLVTTEKSDTELDNDRIYKRKSSVAMDVSDEKDSAASMARNQSFIHLPCVIFKAFNEGNLIKLKEIIKSATTKNCGFHTEAMDHEVFGQNYLIDFFEAMYESHPDAVWVSKKTFAEPEGICSSIYFAGTRIRNKYNRNYSQAMRMIVKENSTLLEEMDTTDMPPEEMEAVMKLDSQMVNVSLYGTGTFKMKLNEEMKVYHVEIGWKISSFRPTDTD